jgi:hypothetical protein
MQQRIAHGVADGRRHIPFHQALAWMICPVLCAIAIAGAQAAEEHPLQVVAVGSSSFSKNLRLQVSGLAAVAGHPIAWTSSSYTRLDHFATTPGLYDEWCRNDLPSLLKEKRDVVVLQTIGWFNLSPEQQDRLIQIVADLTGRLHTHGAKVILYDKYPEILNGPGSDDPLHAGWSGRYPRGVDMNCLLHLRMAVEAKVDEVCFSGPAILELERMPEFRAMGTLFRDPSHPAPVANLATAVILANLLVGYDPAVHPPESADFGESFAVGTFQKSQREKPDFYKQWQGRFTGNLFALVPAESSLLVETAMRAHRYWDERMRRCLQDEAYRATQWEDLAKIRAGMDTWEQAGFPKSTIESVRKEFAEVAAGELTPHEHEVLVSKLGSITYRDAALRKLVSDLPKADFRMAQNRFHDHWSSTNSKFRDDTMYQGELASAKAVKTGERDKAKAIDRTLASLNAIYALPGWRILYDLSDEAGRKSVLAGYELGSAVSKDLPRFAAYHTAHAQDPERLFAGWDAMLNVVTDPDLLDGFRDKGYPGDLLKEVDGRFAAWADQHP